MRARITKRVVDTASTEGGRESWVWDTELRGFGLRVRPNGHKTYIVEYRPGAGGRGVQKRRLTIGTHGSPWTPSGAREEAVRILGQVANKHDPAAAKVEARRKDGSTVAELADAFVEKYAKVNQRSWEQTDRAIRHDVLPAIGSLQAEDVTRRDIVRILDTVAERGPIMANRVLAYTRKFFGWCVERGHVADNPCAGIKAPGVAKTRERVLGDDELAEVWRAADAVGWPWGPVVKLLTLTAQRRSEVVGMRWSELDLDKATWSLPGSRTKNKRAHEVPLTAAAVDILRGLPRMPGPFVFSTTGRSAVSAFTQAKAKLNRAILDACGEAEPIPHWTFHDLRRTATTGMARLGIHPHVADAVLNHRTGAIQGVAAIYNRHAYLDERRRALDAWESHVLAILEGRTAGANVVSLRPTAN